MQVTVGLLGLMAVAEQSAMAAPLSVKVTEPLRVFAPAGAVTVAVSVTC